MWDYNKPLTIYITIYSVSHMDSVTISDIFKSSLYLWTIKYNMYEIYLSHIIIKNIGITQKEQQEAPSIICGWSY